MFLKKITLENIRTYENQDIEFPLGSTLLSGDIGSGKTSVLLGLEFALFGLQPGQRGSTLLRNGKKTGSVKIEIEIDNQNIVIERTLKKGKTISQDFCSIIIDGGKKEMSVTELKNFVLELLNYPKEFSKKQNTLYKFTVYTPQEEMKQIIIQDPETRINTLRYIFGVDKYKRILENTLKVALKIREEKRMKEGIIFGLEQDKINKASKEADLESKFQNLASIEKELFLKKEKRKKIQDESQEISKKIEEKNKLQQEIEKTKIIISNKRESVYSNAKIISQIKAQIEELQILKFDESKLSELEDKKILNKKKRETVNEEFFQISSQINSLNMKNDENKKIEQKISNLDICPTCLQNVAPVYRANVLNKLQSDSVENNHKINSLKHDKAELSEKISKINDEISSIEKQIQEMNLLKIRLHGIKEKNEQLVNAEKLNSMLKKDLELLEQHIDSTKTSVAELKKFENIFEAKQNELEKAIKEERNAEIKIAELKKEIEVFSKQINEIGEKIKSGEKIKEQLNYLGEIEDWLSKKFSPLISFIEKNVMLKLRAEFSKLFAEWFYMLVPEGFNIRVGEDFSPIIEYQDYELDYSYLSGGERTAVALAYRMALNQVINSLLSRIKTKDIVILDEPTDGFSSQQLDKMRDIFQQLKVAQLILVSHEQKMEDFVENVIRFRKEGGISKVG